MAQKGELRVRVSAEDKASPILKRVTGGIIALAGAYLSIQGIRSIIGLVKGFTDAAMVQEKAIAKLTTQLRNHNELTQENVDALLDQASALQKVTMFGDEQIIAGQAMLASFGLTTKQLKEMTPRMLDVAVMTENTTGQMADLATVAKMVGVALGGQPGQLTRMGIKLSDAQKELWKTSDAQERFNLLLEIFDENAANLATTLGKTFQGQLIRSKNLIGDLKETIGEVITKNTAWKAIIEFVNIKLGELSDWLKDNQQAVMDWSTQASQSFINFADFAVTSLMDVATAAAATLKAMIQISTFMSKLKRSTGIISAQERDMLTMTEEIESSLTDIGTSFQTAKMRIEGLSVELRDFVNTAIREAGPAIEGLSGALGGGAGGAAGGKGGGAPLNQVLLIAHDRAEQFNKDLKIMSGYMETVTLVTDEAKATSLEAFEKMRNAMHDYTQMFASSMIDSLFDARQAFHEYVRDFMAGITKMIIKMMAFKAIQAGFGFATGGAGFLPMLFGQHGIVIPGGPPYRDRVPVMTTPGELLLNRQQVAAAGGPAGVQRAINNTFSPTINVTVNSGGDAQYDGNMLASTLYEKIKEYQNRGML